MSTIKSAFINKYGALGFFHHLIFPLDLMYSEDREWLASREMKINELTPIMVWLIPLVILLSGTISFNLIGMLIFILFLHRLFVFF